MKVKWLMLACLLMPVLVAVGCAPTKAPAPKAEVPAGYESLRIIGGSLGGRTTTGAMTYATIFSKYYPEISWSSCSGSVGTSPIFLTKGTEKLGYLLSINYIDAYGFDKIPQSRLRSINLPTALSQGFFLIPEDKPWKDITEVPKGLTLCPGAPGNEPLLAEAWLNHCGLSKKDFNWVPLGGSEMADAWRQGKVDIIFKSIGGMAPFLMDMYTSPRKFKPMGMSPEQVAKAKAEKTFERIGYEAPAKTNMTEIIPEIFKEEVICPQAPAFLGCRDDFPEEIAYKMARIIDEHSAEMAQIFPAMKFGLAAQWHIRWAGPPYNIHPGVAKYYREKGYLK